MFKRAKQIFSDDERNEPGERMEAKKKQLQARSTVCLMLVP